MLTGHDLGAAIEAARLKKGITKKDLAAWRTAPHMLLAPPRRRAPKDVTPQPLADE